MTYYSLIRVISIIHFSLHTYVHKHIKSLTFFFSEDTSTPASAATVSNLLRLVSNTLRFRSFSRVRRHTSSCLGRRSDAKSRAHNGQRAIPFAGGPRSADICCLIAFGCGRADGPRCWVATGCLVVAADRCRDGATGFGCCCCCCRGRNIPGPGILAALITGLCTPAAAVAAAPTLATAEAVLEPAASALITVGCTTGGKSSLLGVTPIES